MAALEPGSIFLIHHSSNVFCIFHGQNMIPVLLGIVSPFQEGRREKMAKKSISLSEAFSGASLSTSVSFSLLDIFCLSLQIYSHPSPACSVPWQPELYGLPQCILCPLDSRGELQAHLLCEAGGRYWKEMGRWEKSEVEQLFTELFPSSSLKIGSILLLKPQPLSVSWELVKTGLNWGWWELEKGSSSDSIITATLLLNVTGTEAPVNIRLVYHQPSLGGSDVCRPSQIMLHGTIRQLKLGFLPPLRYIWAFPRPSPIFHLFTFKWNLKQTECIMCGTIFYFFILVVY